MKYIDPRKVELTVRGCLKSVYHPSHQQQYTQGNVVKSADADLWRYLSRTLQNFLDDGELPAQLPLCTEVCQ